jgi:hypothetical protein
MEKDLRTANGLIRHLEILRNFNKSFRTFKSITYQQLALIISFLPYLKNNVFRNIPGTIPELMQVITTDNSHIIHENQDFNVLKITNLNFKIDI